MLLFNLQEFRHKAVLQTETVSVKKENLSFS